MTDYLEIIKKYKNKCAEQYDFESAAEFREIENWLNFKHPIEEIFENKLSYRKVVQIELLKLERRKKLDIIKNAKPELFQSLFC